MASHEGRDDQRTKSQLQSSAQRYFQRCCFDCRSMQTRRSNLSSLQCIARRWHQTAIGQADHCSSDCVNYTRAMENRRGVRTEKIVKAINRLWEGGALLCIGSASQCREPRRRKGFEGEYQLMRWSRADGPESPRIGYSPSESQTKRWAHESLIEASFSYFTEEQNGSKVTGKAEQEPTVQWKHSDWNAPRFSIEDQPPQSRHTTRRVATDAGCKTNCISRCNGCVRVDTPHYRNPH